MLKYTDLTGRHIDRVQTAIDRIRAFCPPEGYYLAFSGGKDSVCIKALADMAGVKYDAHYNATTVDPPELVRFIIREYPDVKIEKPEIPMIKLIPQNHMPPTRIVRYCCAYYKERTSEGRVTMTGTRWAESPNRRNNQGIATIFNGKKARHIANENGAEYREAKRGGIVLNYDNAAARRTVESCYRTNKTLVNPIIDWSDNDVWEFIRTYDIKYCPLYDEGWKRLGCVGCPMAQPESRIAQFRRWPAIYKIYMMAFEDMLVGRKKRGKTDPWKTAEDVMRWWIQKPGGKQIEGQMSIFDEDGDE